MLHISTDYVFEGNKVGEYVETDATNPQGVNLESKLAGEIAVAEAAATRVKILYVINLVFQLMLEISLQF